MGNIIEYVSGQYKVNTEVVTPYSHHLQVEGDRVGVWNLTSKKFANGQLERFDQWIDPSGNPYTSLEDLITDLNTFFFDIVVSNFYPEVNTFADLPDPVANVGKTYHVINSTGSWFLLNRRQSGLYRSDGAQWVLRNDISSLLVDNEFNIRDDADNTKGIRFVLDNLTTGLVRAIEFQDKDYVVADDAVKADKVISITGQNSISGGGDLSANRILQLLNDLANVPGANVYAADVSGVRGWQQIPNLISNNAGQIKLNWTAANRPESPSGFSGGTPQDIDLNQNYTVSASPTTTYPYLANSLIGGQNVIDPATNYLRELLAGQSITFRVKCGYLNKGAGQNGNIIIRMLNPNPASTLVISKSIPTPDGTNAYEQEFEFIAIADPLSLDPLYGYRFEAETTFGDGNLIVYISEITAFYNSVENFNKT